MRLKPESVWRRGHYTTEDSVKNWPKWKYLLVRFFKAVWNKWIIFPIPIPPFPPPPPPNTHTKTILNLVCHYVLILCTFFFLSVHSFVVYRHQKALREVVYSADRSKAVFPVLVVLFVALRRFVYVLTLCYLILVSFSPFNIAITSLGEERANLSAFCTFVRFVVVWFYRFPLPLGVWKGLRFVIVALLGLLSDLFCYYIKVRFKGVNII